MPLPDTPDDIERRERDPPCDPLPRRTHAREGDHGAVGVSGAAGDQLDDCMGYDDPPVLAQGWDLHSAAVHATAFHRSVKAPPVKRAKRAE